MRKTNRLADVILLQPVQGLGSIGEMVGVRRGYFRNCLGPKGIALEASENNKKMFEERKEALFQVDEERRLKAEALSEKVQTVSLIMRKAVTPEGQLYGSVSAHDILEALSKEGFHIDRSQVKLPKPIKDIGEHRIPVQLHPHVTAMLTVTIDPQI
jgi:large subunit ribosomal protein L9